MESFPPPPGAGGGGGEEVIGKETKFYKAADSSKNGLCPFALDPFIILLSSDKQIEEVHFLGDM